VFGSFGGGLMNERFFNFKRKMKINIKKAFPGERNQNLQVVKYL